MKRLVVIILALTVLPFVSKAQDEVGAKKHENVTWHSIVFVDFKPGKVQEAKKIIEQFKAAAEKAQTQKPITYWMETGKYDMMLVWTLEGGPSMMEYMVTPSGAKWWKAFVELQGSEEAAKKLQGEYYDMVAGYTSDIAMIQK